MRSFFCPHAVFIMLMLVSETVWAEELQAFLLIFISLQVSRSSSAFNTSLPLLTVSISNHQAFWEKQLLVFSSKQMNNKLAVFKFPLKPLPSISFAMVTPEPNSVGSGAVKLCRVNGSRITVSHSLYCKSTGKLTP